MKALRAIDDILCANPTAMRLPARFILSFATLYFTVGVNKPDKYFGFTPTVFPEKRQYDCAQG